MCFYVEDCQETFTTDVALAAHIGLHDQNLTTERALEIAREHLEGGA